MNNTIKLVENGGIVPSPYERMVLESDARSDLRKPVGPPTPDRNFLVEFRDPKDGEIKHWEFERSCLRDLLDDLLKDLDDSDILSIIDRDSSTYK